MNKLTAVRFLVATCAAMPALLLANGMRLVSQDGFATARGEAFAATADNPSAIYYNPAGITQLDGTQLRAGITRSILIRPFSRRPPPAMPATPITRRTITARPPNSS